MVYNDRAINIFLLPTGRNSFSEFHSWAMPDKSMTRDTGLRKLTTGRNADAGITFFHHFGIYYSFFIIIYCSKNVTISSCLWTCFCHLTKVLEDPHSCSAHSCKEEIFGIVRVEPRK
jgi:hypothetical protein